MTTEAPPSGAISAPAPAEGSHARRLVQDVLIYGSGRLALQLFPFLALPILTRIFTPSDYTVIETTSAVTALLLLVATLGLDSASQRSYFDYSDAEVRERNAMLSTAFWTIGAFAAALALVLGLAAAPISSLLFGDGGYSTPLAIALATVPLTVLANFFQEIMRLRHQPWCYALVSAVAGATTTTFVLWFVAGPRWGLTGFYAGFLVGTLAPLAVGFWIVRDAIRPVFDRREFRVMMAYGLPLVWMGAFAWAVQLVDRFFLVRMAPFEDAGLYGVGARLANVLLLVVIGVGVAWSPFILEINARDPEHARAIRGRVLTIMTLALSLSGAALASLAPEVFRIVTGAGFERASDVVGLLTLGNVFFGLSAIVGTGITFARRTRYFAIYGLYAATTNVALNVALIPPLGMTGAAVATLITYGLLAYLYWWREGRLGPAPYDLARVGAILGLSAATGVAGTLVVVDPLWLGVVLKVVALAGLAVALFRVADAGREVAAIRRSIREQRASRTAGTTR